MGLVELLALKRRELICLGLYQVETDNSCKLMYKVTAVCGLRCKSLKCIGRVYGNVTHRGWCKCDFFFYISSRHYAYQEAYQMRQFTNAELNWRISKIIRSNVNINYRYHSLFSHSIASDYWMHKKPTISLILLQWVYNKLFLFPFFYFYLIIITLSTVTDIFPLW
jgi:hypothetical protein